MYNKIVRSRILLYLYIHGFPSTLISLSIYHYKVSPDHGDGMYSCIITESKELIVRINIFHSRTERINKPYEIEYRQLNEIPGNYSIIHNMNEIAYPGDHNFGIQLFYPQKNIIDLKVQTTTTNCNGKDSINIGMIKEKTNEYDYQLDLTKGKKLTV